MELSNSIANLSMQMSAVNTSSKFSTGLLSKVMDFSEQSAMGIVEMIDDVNPAVAFPGDVGYNFDARA